MIFGSQMVLYDYHHSILNRMFSQETCVYICSCHYGIPEKFSSAINNADCLNVSRICNLRNFFHWLCSYLSIFERKVLELTR